MNPTPLPRQKLWDRKQKKRNFRPGLAGRVRQRKNIPLSFSGSYDNLQFVKKTQQVEKSHGIENHEIFIFLEDVIFSSLIKTIVRHVLQAFTFPL